MPKKNSPFHAIISDVIIKVLITLIPHNAKTIIFTPQLAGEARQLGCPKIVLDHVRVCIYI